MNEFVATLAHEMRNPLSALTYALQVWVSLQDDSPQMSELHDVMKRQVVQLTRLCEDLLDQARLILGKLELSREHIDVGRVIDYACEQIKPFINRCGHSLNVKLPAEPLIVDGDASRLLQVFANLIQNAAKFTDKNGCLHVDVDSQEGMAVVRIRDNGRGIEKDMLPSIFDVFKRGDISGGASKNDGLGIGLHLVKTVVDLHGGTVDAHSEGLGHGSEFIVRLPCNGHMPPPAPSDATAWSLNG
ncbi:MAG: HAMP domain-containing sensor histidine kinase [Planctomycetaceae bacterium]